MCSIRTQTFGSQLSPVCVYSQLKNFLSGSHVRNDLESGLIQTPKCSNSRANRSCMTLCPFNYNGLLKVVGCTFLGTESVGINIDKMEYFLINSRNSRFHVSREPLFHQPYGYRIRRSMNKVSIKCLKILSWIFLYFMLQPLYEALVNTLMTISEVGLTVSTGGKSFPAVGWWREPFLVQQIWESHAAFQT